MKPKSFFLILASSCIFTVSNYLVASDEVSAFPTERLVGNKEDNWMPRARIEDIGNKPDSLPGNHGSVSYAFSMGICDVTAEQYCDFLNAVAAYEDPYNLYDTRMGTDESIKCIERQKVEDRFVYHLIEDREKLPITYVDIYSAARFCNWMHHGCPVGVEAIGSTENGAYVLEGAMRGPIIRKLEARWFLPTEDEWYKGAYYNHSDPKGGYYRYPNSTDEPPSNHFKSQSNNEANYDCYYRDPLNGNLRITGAGIFTKSKSPYNLYDMGGNIDQWTETEVGRNKIGVNYVIRGGSWKSVYRWIGSNDLESSSCRSYEGKRKCNTLGFRVACASLEGSEIVVTSQAGIKQLCPAQTTAAIALLSVVAFGARGSEVEKPLERATKELNLEEQPLSEIVESRDDSNLALGVRRDEVEELSERDANELDLKTPQPLGKIAEQIKNRDDGKVEGWVNVISRLSTDWVSVGR